MERSVRFYRDGMGLVVRSRSGQFATLDAANLGVYLWTRRWDWEAPRQPRERQGLGMYPHFEVADVAGTVERLRQAGYQIVQPARHYSWGTEAFVADPDGYTWALVTMGKH